MKNKILFIAISWSLIASFTSCKKDYLDTSPTNSVSSGDAFTTTANAMAALNGIHRAMFVRYNSQGEFGQGAIMINLEVLGDDYVMTGVGNGWYNNEYKWISHRIETSALCRYGYEFYYRLIGNANLIIANVDNAQGTPAEKSQIKGEALTYRAWCYFMLVQLYGKRYDPANAGNNTQPGVSLVLTPTTEGLPRSSVEQVYAQINKDLDDAIALLTTSRPNKSHFNKNIAQGIKARVALTQGKWNDAATLAVAARSGFSLMSNTQYQDGFADYANPEWMWGSKQPEDQSTFFASYHAYISCNYNSTNIRTNPKAINSTLYNMMSPTDIRRKMWDPTGSAAAVTPPGGLRRPYMTQKFRLPGTPSTSVAGDVPHMRAGEMYLIEAEARARNNQDALAQQALFTLMSNRDPNYVMSTNTGQALIDEIMINRRIELWGEGFRFTDLKRLNLPLNRNGANHTTALALIFDVAAGDNQWEWLIPRYELDANPNSSQNP